MTFDDNERLSAQARRGLIQAQLPGLISQGIGQTDALRIFRQAGLGIRAQEFGALYRLISGSEERSQRVQFVRRDAQVSENVLDQSRIPFTARYRFGFDIVARNQLTGELEPKSFAIDTDRLMTRQELEDIGRELFDASNSEPLHKTHTIQLKRGYVYREEF